ncbi:MAG: HAD family phosphatase [Candidatus Diapherotrites archaeon]|nr:HAD family phosphatase [Candidatus Diapherotrites archaeon]
MKLNEVDFKKICFIFDLEGVLIQHISRQAKIIETAFEETGIKLRFKIKEIYHLRTYPEIHGSKKFFPAIYALNKSDIKLKECKENIYVIEKIINEVKKLAPMELRQAGNAEIQYMEMRKKPELFQELETVIPGAQKTIRFLKKNGIKIAVATRAHKIQNEALLKRFGLKEYIDYSVTKEDFGMDNEFKQTGEPTLKIAEQLKIQPKHCIFVEDSVAGIKGAKLAGAKTIGVLTGTSSKTQFEIYGKPDLVLKSVAEIKEKFKTIVKLIK